MNLEIVRIRSAGNPQKERLVMRALGNVELGQFAVFAARVDGSGLTNDVIATYWFPDGKAREDDLIVLYTKEGRPKRSTSADGVKSHFFYWGVDETLWDDDSAPVLVKISDWAAEMP